MTKIDVGMQWCPECRKKTQFIWVETDRSWYRQTGQVSGYWECLECGCKIRV